jgi:hypothetical protein
MRRPCCQPRIAAPRPWPCVFGRFTGWSVFWQKFWQQRESSYRQAPRSSRGVSRFAHLRWAGEEVMPSPISSSACISSSRSSSAVGHVAARSRLGEVVWVRRVAEPARYARARRGGEGGREPPPGQIHRAWQSHRAVGWSTRARVRRIAPPRDGRAPERASRASVSTWPSSTPLAGACVRRP